VALDAGLGVLLSRPEQLERRGDILRPAPATAKPNPAGAVWWADGLLHLSDSVVEVEDVRRLVAAGSGAAYADGEGRLIAVTSTGDRTLLGRVADRSPLVSSPRLGLVAWADVSVPDVTKLVVWDVEEGQQVAGVTTRPGVRPITFDGGWLRFGQGLSDYAWDPSGGPAQLTGDGFSEDATQRTALVDAVAGTRLEQWGTYLRVVRSGRRGATEFAGFGGVLSPDGRFVLTGPDQRRQPRLFDARTGERLDAWGPSWHVHAAAFSGTDEVTWLVEDLPSGELSFLVCGPRSGDACPRFVRLGDPDEVVLAGDSRRQQGSRSRMSVS
jgi:hypothetical protein